ncbi:MAG: hypothetical protein QNL51_13070 [Opitutaceae bacterium]
MSRPSSSLSLIFDASGNPRTSAQKKCESTPAAMKRQVTATRADLDGSSERFHLSNPN